MGTRSINGVKTAQRKEKKNTPDYACHWEKSKGKHKGERQAKPKV
jgi:hypothetical protein